MTVGGGLYMLVVWKTCGYGGLVASSPRMRCRSASLQTPFLFFVFVSTDLKVRGYWPSASRLSDAHPFPFVPSDMYSVWPSSFASRLSDALSLCVIFDGWVDLICALFKV